MIWIGGAPGTGKTTLALRLVRRYGLRWYGADTRTWEHRDRALHAGISAAHRWEALTPEQRLAAPPEEQLAMSLHAERGPMVVADLLALPPSPLIVAEGTTVPAAAAERRRALWLLPTPELREEQRSRGTRTRVLYEVLTEAIEQEAEAHGVPVRRADGVRTAGETFALAEELFADPLRTGPRAEGPEERRTLLREANDAVAAQIRGYFARPWARGDADSVVRPFVCECGDPTCVATVETAVAAATAGPVLARGHGDR